MESQADNLANTLLRAGDTNVHARAGNGGRGGGQGTKRPPGLASGLRPQGTSASSLRTQWHFLQTHPSKTVYRITLKLLSSTY